MRTSRLAACFLAVASVAALAAPALAADPLDLVTTKRVTMVGALDGFTVWSEFTDGLGYTLSVRKPTGEVSSPSIPARAVPFDVDLGTDALDNVVATYSRCTKEPRSNGGVQGTGPLWTTGKGCRINILDLATGAEKALKLAKGNSSEVLPSLAGRTLAYVATTSAKRDRKKAFLSVRSVGVSVIKPKRLFTGSRVAGGPGTGEGPTSTDTDGARVAFAWRSSDPEFHSFDSNIWVQKLSAKSPASVGGASNSEECSYETVLAPTLVAGNKVTYLGSTGADWQLTRSSVAKRSPAYDVAVSEEASVGIVTSAALDGKRLVTAETAGELGNAKGETRIREQTVGGFTAKATVGC